MKLLSEWCFIHNFSYFFIGVLGRLIRMISYSVEAYFEYDVRVYPQKYNIFLFLNNRAKKKTSKKLLYFTMIKKGSRPKIMNAFI